MQVEVAGGHFSIRREIIEYGSLPISKWLHGIDGSAAVQQLQRRLLKASVQDSEQRNLVDIQTLARCLDVTVEQTKVMVDVLDSVALEQLQVVQRSGSLEPEVVDVHAVTLFLFAQLYIRQMQQHFAMEVWPGQNDSPPTQEPVSPHKSKAPNSHFAHFQQQRSNQVVRKELQQHLQQYQQTLHGYTEYMQRNAATLLALCSGRGQSEGGHGSSVSAGEVDRLALLLAPAGGEQHTPDDGSPMDICPTPFTADLWRLSPHIPMFKDATSAGAEAPVQAVADWLGSSILDESGEAESMQVGSPTHASGKGKWDALPPAGIVQSKTSGVVDVQGVCKSTVIKGEDAFPEGVLRVTDCHDTIVYALAPLQYASVFCCSDCTVVLGAVGRMVRVERCERVQVIAACVRICISSCHDCIFYLGVNRIPLLLGDNRFLQLAPYNTQYERLAAHMEAVGVSAEPNLWDHYVTLAREHGRGSADAPDPSAGASPGEPGPLAAPPPLSLLAPDKLLPFMVPFQGGPGPMAGGPAASSSSQLRWSADVGNLVGLGSLGGDAAGSSSGSTIVPPSPFKLPAAYEEAKDQKIQSVAELRSVVKSAVLDEPKKRELQNVIQAYFKEWLLSSGNMRQVYDLARIEREDSPPS